MSLKKVILFTGLSITIYACSTRSRAIKQQPIPLNPYALTNQMYHEQTRILLNPLQNLAVDSIFPATFPVGTVNFNLRKPNYVIIHHTAQGSCDSTLKTFTTVRTQVSAHYVICKDGTIHHMLNDYFRAWHAGVSKWGTISDINSVSLGIEIDNNGIEEFTNLQISSLLNLLTRLKKNYNIPASNFIGHSDVAPARKQDPSTRFPWKLLSETGFGYWPDAVLDTAVSQFNGLQGLRLIGYDTKDSIAAITAFKRHFIQTDISPVLTANDKSIIKNLISKY